MMMGYRITTQKVEKLYRNGLVKITIFTANPETAFSNGEIKEVLDDLSLIPTLSVKQKELQKKLSDKLSSKTA